MAKKKISGEVLPPDFDAAHDVYVHDVQPANKDQKRAMKAASSAWKEIKNEHHVHTGGYRTAMKVAEMEEADQQSWLRSFNAGLKKRNVGLHADLADIAQGNGGDQAVVPTVSASTIELPTIN